MAVWIVTLRGEGGAVGNEWFPTMAAAKVCCWELVSNKLTRDDYPIEDLSIVELTEDGD